MKKQKQKQQLDGHTSATALCSGCMQWKTVSTSNTPSVDGNWFCSGQCKRDYGQKAATVTGTATATATATATGKKARVVAEVPAGDLTPAILNRLKAEKGRRDEIYKQELNRRRQQENDFKRQKLEDEKLEKLNNLHKGLAKNVFLLEGISAFDERAARATSNDTTKTTNLQVNYSSGYAGNYDGNYFDDDDKKPFPIFPQEYAAGEYKPRTAKWWGLQVEVEDDGSRDITGRQPPPPPTYNPPPPPQHQPPGNKKR